MESSWVARFSDLDFMCGAAQLESGAAVTRAATRISDPRGAGAELDPQRGEAGKQLRLPQSFTLTDVGVTSSMRPVAEVQATVGDEVASTSRDVDAGVTSPLMEAAKALCHSPVFSVS
jgi:hypothetical protein